MQAIISDIIVNQAIQTGNLQISQLSQNDSSSQQSFIDMLNSIRTEQSEVPEKETELKASYEEKKPVETQESAKEQKTESSEKAEEQKDSSVKDSESEQKSHKTDDKTVEENKKETGTKPKLLNKDNTEVTEKKSGAENLDSKQVKNNADSKKIKTDLEEKNPKITEETEAQNKDAVINNQAASVNASVNNFESNSDAKAENLENKAISEIETAGVALENPQNELLQDKLSADEKVYALDKDSKIIVHDQRTEQTDETKPSEKNTSKGQVQVQFDNQNNATITMELAEQNASENILSLDNQTATSNGSNFQAMISNQIQANAPEFVKAGSLILQNNDKGTINLVLHPDDLGNVKIHLTMDGKTVSAHITVNTKEALEVFKDNAQTLREAFAKNGFDTASFDVSYNGSSQNGQNNSFEGKYDGTEYWARNAYNDSLGGETAGYIPESYDFAMNSEYSINIVA